MSRKLPDIRYIYVHVSTQASFETIEIKDIFKSVLNLKHYSMDHFLTAKNISDIHVPGNVMLDHMLIYRKLIRVFDFI